jgi:hypothetical protein
MEAWVGLFQPPGGPTNLDVAHIACTAIAIPAGVDRLRKGAGKKCEIPEGARGYQAARGRLAGYHG